MNFLDTIQADIDWRMGDIGTLKSLSKRYNMSQAHQNLIIRYTMPAIYALWEGFVKSAFYEYIKQLNSKNLINTTVHINILTYAVESNDKLRLNDARTQISTQRKFVQLYNEYYESPLHISPKIMTNDNVDYKTICILLESFNLERISAPIYEAALNRMVFLRNEVAHGGQQVPITMEDVEQYSQLVIDLMSDILGKMETGYKCQSYLKDSYRQVQNVD